jgi:enoyl-[acyl-carrier protein] reductase II
MIDAGSAATFLRLKKLVPVRLLHNSFSETVRQAEDSCADAETLSQILGKGRAKLGMLDGDLEQGELEIGQIVSIVGSIPSCQQLLDTLTDEYRAAKSRLCNS